MFDFLLGVAITAAVVGINLMVYNTDVSEDGFITYEQQEQDKEQCERNIRRSEHCVPDILWLPVASDLAE